MGELKVWIDPDLCTGDGLCTEICPDIFEMADSGLAYVRELPKNYPDADLTLEVQKDGVTHLGQRGLARIPSSLIDAAIESADECPGECIFIEPAS